MMYADNLIIFIEGEVDLNPLKSMWSVCSSLLVGRLVTFTVSK